jgi:preprotein translocase subunit SecD
MARTATKTKSTQIKLRGSMTEDKIKQLCYTKEEVDSMIEFAVEEARRIDEASMAKHNREATIISMILGFTALALFVDGLLRILGIIPPFMHLDVNIIEKVTDRVEMDVMHKIRQVPLERLFGR